MTGLRPARLFERAPWLTRAACAQVDHSKLDWFPERMPGRGPQGPYKRRVAVLVNICAGCPVRAECAAMALDEPYWASGVWAGVDMNRLSSGEARRQLRKIAEGGT